MSSSGSSGGSGSGSGSSSSASGSSSGSNSDSIKGAADQFLAGPFLRKPVTDVLVASGMHKRLHVVTAAMQGWRSTMEDAHLAVLRTMVGKGRGLEREIDILGVFDGHAGVSVPNYLRHRIVAGIKDSYHIGKGNMGRGFRELFLDTDRLVCAKDELADGGSTAVLTLIDRDRIYTAWVGDSRCVLCQDGKAVPMTEDHTTAVASERDRVIKAGSKIVHNRVNGALAMTRAFGDRVFKCNPNLSESRQAVIARPQVRSASLARTQFIVLACDGVWEMMSADAVVAAVLDGLADDDTLDVIAVQILRKCLARASDSSGKGRDNMTLQIAVVSHTDSSGSASSSAPEQTVVETTLDSSVSDSGPPPKRKGGRVDGEMWSGGESFGNLTFVHDAGRYRADARYKRSSSK
eukprot:c10202_g1_i1.p1 GENE.c10202_g1_i1~~c10202_g1_i1.p1  ORF type:complete len:406 (+),score=66.42 c10202_g1_i1:91-1308(+)